jgi:hypothetical protein
MASKNDLRRVREQVEEALEELARQLSRDLAGTLSPGLRDRLAGVLAALDPLFVEDEEPALPIATSTKEKAVTRRQLESDGLSLRKPERHDQGRLPNGTVAPLVEGRRRLMREADPDSLANPTVRSATLSLVMKVDGAIDDPKRGRVAWEGGWLLTFAEAREKLAEAYKAITGEAIDRPWWASPLVGMLERVAFIAAEERLNGSASESEDPRTAEEVLAQLAQVRADAARIKISLPPLPAELTSPAVDKMIGRVGIGKGGRGGGRTAASIVAEFEAKLPK